MPGDEEGQLLEGGNTGALVVRVGDTVRRPAEPWSASVDALLLHLEASGYEEAPRALGYDRLGRQVLSYIEGHVDPDPADLDEMGIADVGRAIRQLHDAVASFVPAPDAVWNVAIPPDSQDLICHNDLAPWNLVRGAGRIAIIDWDGAGPGSRLWELAYAAHGFVPLAPAAALDDAAAGRRLASLVRGYGLDEPERRRLAELLAVRVWSMHDLLQHAHRSGAQPWSQLWDAGHATVWEADGRYVEDRGRIWRAALQV